MNLLDKLAAALSPPDPTAERATPDGHDAGGNQYLRHGSEEGPSYGGGSQPDALTPSITPQPISLDLGPIDRRPAWLDAGGFDPRDVNPARFQGDGREDWQDDEIVHPQHPQAAEKLWNGRRWNILATDLLMSPTTLTPSGIASQEIRRVMMVASVANSVQIGRQSNGAQSGFFLPAGLMIEIFTGPVFAYFTAIGTLDVIVEYTQVEVSGPDGKRKAGKSCDCS